MLVQQLIDNAVFPNPSQLAFARKRTHSSQRDASYYVESYNDEYSILLSVSLCGNIAAQTSRRLGYISHGRHEHSEDWEQVKWSDSNSAAFIRTDLTFDELKDGMDPCRIMKSYLTAIATQGDAMCAGGYAHWRFQVQMLVDLISKKTGKKIELDLIPAMTTCPGMEFTRPWYPPSYETYVIEEDDAHSFEMDASDIMSLNSINEKCMPRRSSILLHPPFMIRGQSREIFLSE